MSMSIEECNVPECAGCGRHTIDCEYREDLGEAYCDYCVEGVRAEESARWEKAHND